MLPIPNAQSATSNQTDSLLGLTEWDALDLESFLKSLLQGSRDDDGLRSGPALSLQKWHIPTLPKFKASIDLDGLKNPKNCIASRTAFHDLKSTFLCAAKEILVKYAREIESPLDHIQEIERYTEGWEPCTGYPVVQATGWNCD